MKKQNFVFWLAAVVAVLSTIGVLGLVVAEAYVRWKLNQNFAFLGTNELPALIILALGLLASLLRATRSEK